MMSIKKPLNTTDEWEDLVNGNAVQRASARERVAGHKMARKIRKLIMSVCVLSATGISFLILGATGAIVDWLTTIGATLCLAAGCFQLGRYLEAKKK